MDALYPPVCPLCTEILTKADHFICSDCRGKLQPIKEPLCKKCGKPLGEENEEFCSDCENTSHNFTEGRAVFAYKPEIKQSIYNFKYKNKREFSNFYVDEICTNLGPWIKRVNPQVLIPIPLYSSKEKTRGFNQASLIAEGIGRRFSIPVSENLIYRVQNTNPQKELSDNFRKKNVEKAFKLSQNIVKLDKVMLIDDIYTTGATIDAVAGVLKAAGIQEIYSLCLCIGKGF